MHAATAQADFYQTLHFQRFFFAYFVIALVLGVYLIYGGFGKKSVLPQGRRRFVRRCTSRRFSRTRV
jgi:hypothetical protein